MKNRILPILSLGAVSLAAGCNVVQVTTRERTAADVIVANGIVYYLPKTEIEVVAEFDVYVRAKGSRNDRGAIRALLLPTAENAVTVTSRVLPDPDFAFVLKPRTSFWADTTFKAGLDKSGGLVSLNTVYDDKVGPIILDTISTVISVASILKADEDPAWQKTTVHYQVRRKIDAGALLAIGPGGITDFFASEMKDCVNTSDPLLVAAFGKYEFEPPVDGRVEAPWAPCQVSLVASVGGPDDAAAKAAAAPKPGTPPTRAAALIGKIGKEIHNDDTELPGVIYRLKNPGTLTISLGKARGQTIAIDVTDAAPTGFTEIRGGLFSKRTHELKFGETGTLSEYTLERTSAGAAIAATAKGATAAVDAELKAREEAREKRADARDKAAKDALVQQRALDGATIELESLEAQIVAAQAELTAAAPADRAAKETALNALRRKKAELEVTIRALRLGVLLD